MFIIIMNAVEANVLLYGAAYSSRCCYILKLSCKVDMNHSITSISSLKQIIQLCLVDTIVVPGIKEYRVDNDNAVLEECFEIICSYCTLARDIDNNCVVQLMDYLINKLALNTTDAVKCLYSACQLSGSEMMLKLLNITLDCGLRGNEWNILHMLILSMKRIKSDILTNPYRTRTATAVLRTLLNHVESTLLPNPGVDKVNSIVMPFTELIAYVKQLIIDNHNVAVEINAENGLTIESFLSKSALGSKVHSTSLNKVHNATVIPKGAQMQLFVELFRLGNYMSLYSGVFNNKEDTLSSWLCVMQKQSNSESYIGIVYLICLLLKNDKIDAPITVIMQLLVLINKNSVECVGEADHAVVELFYQLVLSRVALNNWLFESNSSYGNVLYNILKVDNSSNLNIPIMFIKLKCCYEYALSLLQSSYELKKNLNDNIMRLQCSFNILHYCGSQLALLLSMVADQHLYVNIPHALKFIRHVCSTMNHIHHIASTQRKQKSMVATTVTKLQDKCITNTLHCSMHTIIWCSQSISSIQIISTRASAIDQVKNGSVLTEMKAKMAGDCCDVLSSMWNAYQLSCLWELGACNIVLVLKSLIIHVLNYSQLVNTLANSNETSIHQFVMYNKLENYLRKLSHCLIVISSSNAAIAKEPGVVKHFPLIIVLLVEHLDNYAITPLLKDILFPAVFSYFDKLHLLGNATKQRSIIYNNLTLKGKLIMNELQELYIREYKFTGQI